ncbi:MAG: molybdopterin converting factor subunit 1 [candidate division Zixibacteria bacterium]|nr:molybdopterin converting factor subunit 1 [candidate division Zixibacteria bacterium]MDH3938401.1 molybdopterin converting factor subunit 1 [candidate division Zixibacteria bacterium]
MKQIKMLYFAKLKEETGVDSETVSTSAHTAANLYDELRDRYLFSLDSSVTQVAINEEFATMNTELTDGDQVVFIPPVAGG